MMSCRILQRLVPVVSISGEHGSWKLKQIALSEAIIRARDVQWQPRMTSHSFLSCQSDSYLPEPTQSMKGQTVAQVLKRGLFSLEEGEVYLGSNLGDYIYSEDKIRSHKVPGMVLEMVQSGRWRQKPKSMWCPGKLWWPQSPKHGFLASDNNGGLLGCPGLREDVFCIV